MATAVKQEIHQDLRSMPSTYANRLVCGVKPKVAKRYGNRTRTRTKYHGFPPSTRYTAVDTAP